MDDSWPEEGATAPTSAPLRPDSEVKHAMGQHFPLFRTRGSQIHPMKKTHSQDVKTEAENTQPVAQDLWARYHGGADSLTVLIPG